VFETVALNGCAVFRANDSGFKIKREHSGEFHRHGRASVWRSRGDHRQKTLYRFHEDVGNEKRFLV